MSDDEQEPVGSVGEEAAKLIHALQGWAGDEHIATGGRDCKYCPVCQVISALRETSPEVKEHLAVAATSLMHAVAGVLETQVPDPRTKFRGDTGVEKIDLTDGEDSEDDTWD